MSRHSLYLAEFDELERTESYIWNDYVHGFISKEEVADQFEDLFVHAYKRGYSMGQNDLELDEADIAYFDSMLSSNAQKIFDSVYRKIDGKDFKERIYEHLNAGDGEAALKKLFSTEVHRNMGAGRYQLGKDYEFVKKKNVTKTWRTMLDEKVRDTHGYMEGMEVGIDDDFYTYNGDHAPYPGFFGVAEEDINCRCIAELHTKE